jgi:hypothetical protein
MSKRPFDTTPRRKSTVRSHYRISRRTGKVSQVKEHSRNVHIAKNKYSSQVPKWIDYTQWGPMEVRETENRDTFEEALENANRIVSNQPRVYDYHVLLVETTAGWFPYVSQGESVKRHKYKGMPPHWFKDSGEFDPMSESARQLDTGALPHRPRYWEEGGHPDD